MNDEFPEVPVNHIKNILGEKQSLFTTYLTIAEQERQYKGTPPIERMYKRVKSRSSKSKAKSQLKGPGSSEVVKELQAAKAKVEAEESKSTNLPLLAM